MGRKTLDIIVSSIIYTYDFDKTYHCSLKTLISHSILSLFQNGNDTMGNISNWKLATANSVRIFCEKLSPILLLTYWPNTISRKLKVKETSGVHFIYSKMCVQVVVKKEEMYNVPKQIYIILIQIIHRGMYNNGNAKFLQYIFEWEPKNKKTLSYLYLILYQSYFASSGLERRLSHLFKVEYMKLIILHIVHPCFACIF